MRYRFVPTVRMMLEVVVDHDEGLLRFTLKNIDALETVTCSFPAHETGQGRRLDELAHGWLGEPNRILAGARDVRRIEAR